MWGFRVFSRRRRSDAAGQIGTWVAWLSRWYGVESLVGLRVVLFVSKVPVFFSTHEWQLARTSREERQKNEPRAGVPYL